jgi:hypothetical protein
MATIALVLIGAVFTGVLIVTGTVGQEWKQERLDQITHIQEDDPGWDCVTMGNHLCGPSQ